MKSAAEIIRRLLIDLDKVEDHSASVWASFVSFLPETPKKAVCFYDTEGAPDGRIQRTGERIEHPGIQILVRAPDYSDAYEKAREIATTLDAQDDVDVAFPAAETYVVHNVSRSGTILSLGMMKVGSERFHVFTVNAIVTLKQKV